MIYHPMPKRTKRDIGMRFGLTLMRVGMVYMKK